MTYEWNKISFLLVDHQLVSLFINSWIYLHVGFTYINLTTFFSIESSPNLFRQEESSNAKEERKGVFFSHFYLHLFTTFEFIYSYYNIKVSFFAISNFYISSENAGEDHPFIEYFFWLLYYYYPFFQYHDSKYAYVLALKFRTFQFNDCSKI